MRRFCAFLAWVSLASPALAAPVPRAALAPPDLPAADRVVLRLTEEAAARVSAANGREAVARTGVEGLDALNARFGARSIAAPYANARDADFARRLGLDRFRIIELDPSANVHEAARAYAADPSVETADPDWLETPDAVPDDPHFAAHWGHQNTAQLPQFVPATGLHDGPPVGTPGFDSGAPSAWDGAQAFGDPSVIIAMIDADGVDVQHADLRIVAGWDFSGNDPNPDDPCTAPGIGCGHGTKCSGIAAGVANNALGSVGIAGGCSIMPFRASGASQVASALMAAADSGATVACMSFTYYGVTTNPALAAAATYAATNGVLLLGSSGNRNDLSMQWLPKNLPEVYGVGAASPCGERKRSSSNPGELRPDVLPDPRGVTCDNEVNWGSSFGVPTQGAPDALDLIAPVILPAAEVGGGYEMYFSGTSASNAYAVGVAALIKSAHPDWTAAQILQRMFDTAIDIVDAEAGPGWDAYTGHGMVDAAAALAPDAQADLRPETPAGWFDAVVPREAADADTSAVPAPSHLAGDATSYVSAAHGNAGTGPTGSGYDVAWHLDGQPTHVTAHGAAGPGLLRVELNVPLAIPGGRHTLEQRVDPSGQAPESDETNNTAARQWVFEPGTLPAGSVVSRTSPPDPWGGSTSLPPGSSRNQDGIRLDSIAFGQVHAVAAHAEDPSENIDLRAYAPTTGPLLGFEEGTEVETSLRAAGELDVLLFNERVLGPFTMDIGIAEGGTDGTSPSRVEVRKAVPATSGGDPIPLSFPDHEMLAVGELGVGPGEAGSFSFELTSETPGQRMRIAVFPATTGAASLSDAVAVAVTDDPGFGTDVTVLETVLAEGNYPWAVWRDASDGTGAASGSLRVRPTPANVTPFLAPGAHAPLVPAAADSVAECDPWLAPASLPGDAVLRLNYKWTNGGPNPSVTHITHVEVDGIAIPWTDPGQPPSGVFCRTDSLFLRAGRHTFGLEVDVEDANDELYRTDNFYGEQWVLAPVPIASDAPIQRPMPPPATGGWGLVTAAPPHPNCDGLRTAHLAPTLDDGRLALAALVPGSGADVDLVLHPPSGGAQDGFSEDAILAVSAAGGDGIDFVVIDTDTSTGGAEGARDLGVRAASGTADYVAEVTSSRWLGALLGATAGPDTCEAGRVARLYEATAGPAGGDVLLQLRNLSGDADLALAVVRRDGSGYYPRAAAAWANGAGIGANESIPLSLLPGERFGIAVMKHGAAELAKAAEFEIFLGEAIASSGPRAEPPPARTALRSIAPNPFAPSTAIRFDLARPEPVRIDVYDSAGRLVRRLASAVRPAGRHEIIWDGRDDAGRAGASGVYFVRLEAGKMFEVRKVTRLH